MATFLFISPESWTDHAVSKHHYTLALATRGHRVLFLNPPKAEGGLRIVPAAENEHVQVVDAPPVARGLRHMPAPVRRFLERRWLKALEAQSGSHIDAVWLFENSRFFDMSFAEDRLKIYHQVDLNQNFFPERAARSADICFCTTDIIRNELLRSSPHVHKIHHGAAALPATRPLTDEEQGRFRLQLRNAAYVGNLDIPYLDVDLLLATVRAHPQVQFHLIGACSEASPLKTKARMLPNITWWGKQPSALIPSLLANVDILICTYDAERYRDQLASPHKFMEYFASGKVIVSTYTDEYKDKRQLLAMVDAGEDYIRVFSDVVERLDVFNSAQRQQERRAFAAENTYAVQLDRIAALVRKTVPGKASLLRGAVGTSMPTTAPAR